MRQSTLLALSLVVSSSAAFLVLPDLSNLPSVFRTPPVPNHRPNQPQTPMNPGPAIPQAPEDKDTSDPNGDLTISDILPKTRQINIFASLTRDISSVAGRLQSTDPKDNTTLLAPLNSAMQNLPRKPWEDRPDDKSSVRAESNEDKAAQNLQRFVQEHIVPTSPWKEGKDGKIKTLGGQELWWERDGDRRVIMPHALVVDGILGRVGNGEIWAVKGIVNYE